MRKNLETHKEGVYGLLVYLDVWVDGSEYRSQKLLKIEGKEPSACVNVYLKEFWNHSNPSLRVDVKDWKEIPKKDFQKLNEYLEFEEITDEMIMRWTAEEL